MRIKISTFSPVFPSTTDELLYGMLVCNLSVQQGREAQRRPLLWGANTAFCSINCVCVCVCVCLFQPTECEQCTCDSDGIARCLVADCAPPPCVNPIYQPGKCCPECKDGEWKINLKRGRKRVKQQETQLVNVQWVFKGVSPGPNPGPAAFLDCL